MMLTEHLFIIEHLFVYYIIRYTLYVANTHFPIFYIISTGSFLDTSAKLFFS